MVKYELRRKKLTMLMLQLVRQACMAGYSISWFAGGVRYCSTDVDNTVWQHMKLGWGGIRNKEGEEWKYRLEFVCAYVPQFLYS